MAMSRLFVVLILDGDLVRVKLNCTGSQIGMYIIFVKVQYFVCTKDLKKYYQAVLGSFYRFLKCRTFVSQRNASNPSTA